MSKTKLPGLNYQKFKSTKETIQLYAQLLSSIKGQFTPHQKNWEEFSLKIYAKGFTTTPIPVETQNGIEALDLNLNFVEHKLKIFYNGKRESVDLVQPNVKSFTEKLLSKLGLFNIKPDVDEKFLSEEPLSYNIDEVEKIWNAIRQIYFVLLEFKGKQLLETSNINFWAHHFDLAMLMFTGRLLPGQDPENWDYSREQINSGFSLGDEGITEPYFYITAYPFPKDAAKETLPEYMFWQTEGWNGAVMKYVELLNGNDSKQKLTEFLEKISGILLSKMV